MLPVADPSLIFQKVADGAVLFSPRTETYFGLNEVGVAVWALLPPVASSLDELCERLLTQYPEVPLETLRQDVSDLLDGLLKEGLVQLPTAPAGDVEGR